MPDATRDPALPEEPVEGPEHSIDEHLAEGDDPGEGGGVVGLTLGIAVFVLILVLPAPAGLEPDGQRVAAVAGLMAIWWMTEALPLPATALLPIALFPILGVMPTSAATAPYANEIVFLFLGGFMIALAMQRWGLHRRIALAIVARVGVEPRRLVLGFMIATGFLSMWISNTATAVMMLPIGLAILTLIGRERGNLGVGLMLAIAYAASIGGVATLIGTPPNAILAAAASEMLGRTIGFAEWMMVGLPVAVVMMILTWLLLVHFLYPVEAESGDEGSARAVIAEERASLGPLSRGERIVAIVFTVTALAWTMRDPKVLGAFEIPGIATFFPLLTDAAIAMIAALLLFAIPVSLRTRTFALDWKWAVKAPWGVLLLFGGGLSLARGFETTGLAVWIGQQVAILQDVPLIVVILAVATLFCFLTELTSNTATSTMGMPIMAGVAAGVGADPLSLMAAAALASSMAFMLPVATPPNAIVFASGYVTIKQMIRAGIWLNLISILLVTFAGYYMITAVLGP